MISGTLRTRVIDRAEIYADGDFLQLTYNPYTTSTASLPDNTSLLAVRAKDIFTTDSVYGLIIKLSNRFFTGPHWRCSNKEHDNWYKLDYNDDDWPPARVLSWPSVWSPHGLDPAESIWAKKDADVVYCRGRPSKYYSSKLFYIK